MIPRQRSILSWKNFNFPVCITSLSIREEAKVATYEYANRNGAEHERVLNYRVFNIEGVFTYSSSDNNLAPITLVKRLRELNDNKPGILAFRDLGSYTCILKVLKIDAVGDDYEPLIGQLGIQNYKFSMEFWENTPPTEANKNNEQLFPAFNTKPFSDYYTKNLKYTTAKELYTGIINKEIEPGTDPINNAAWLQYNFEMREEAYNMYLDYLENGPPKNTLTTTGQKVYTVKPGDTPMKLAVKNSVSLSDLYQANIGKEVRDSLAEVSSIAGGAIMLTKFWKTPFALFPGDKIKLPDSLQGPELFR